MKTVVVGMSGGVDSSVAALLLKQQGYRVIGLFMKNWEDTPHSVSASDTLLDEVCTSAQDYDDVARVCEKLDIPYYGIEFVKEYRELVFKNFLEEYSAGFTPNPDILCNREIKFNLFFKKALSLGADFLATGHYAQNQLIDGKQCLVKGVDTGKDQTYFLYTIQSQVLSQVLFPIGNLEKSKVREIAKEYGLPTHAKKDSTGICFIGERNFTRFLSEYISIKPGKICTLSGQEVGTHRGIAFYTLGQRKGLGLGGEGDSWFVVGKDIQKNILYAERGAKHPALYADWLMATDLTWVSGAPPLLSPDQPFRCSAKARYRQMDQSCVLYSVNDESSSEMKKVKVVFDQPQRALTPGQSVVFYQGTTCFGGGIIRQIGPSYYEQGRTLFTCAE